MHGFSIAIFLIIHWVIAFIYYECAQSNPFLRNQPTYSNARARTILIIVIACGIITSFYSFIENKTIEAIFAVTWLIILVCASITMCVALVQIRNAI